MLNNNLALGIILAVVLPIALAHFLHWLGW